MSHILPFIEFCADSYPDAKEITKEMLDRWLLTKNFNADSTRRIAIINIRHFARFLNAIGKKAYIPPSEYNVKAQRYLPYIFTDEELVQLFDSIDSLTNRIDRQEYHPELILPVVFRLELCCGMRPGEPFNLKTDVLYQLLEKVTVLDEARIKVTFRSGVEIEQALEKDERSVTA